MKKILIALLPLLLSPLPAMADQTVVQKGRRFNPSEITIQHGENITVTNNDEFIHQIYSEGLFDTDERAPGQNIVENFAQAGTFEVRCHIHPKMKLIVHVN